MIAGMNFLRYVIGSSVVHRANARTKVLALTVLVFTLSFDPSWSSVAIVWGAVAVTFIAARLPLGVRPRPPRLLVWSIGVSLLFGLAAGGEPNVDIGGLSLGLDGLLVELRFFSVALALLALSLLLGWTTAMADLPAAAGWMLGPLRRLRVPVDDVIAALTLAVRALPLMADELATTSTLWRLRPKNQPNVVVEMVDFAATATTSAVRRATELGETLVNRGPVVPATRRASWSAADLWVGFGAAATVAAMIVLP
ncbi:MAG: energy-coupling factor transporter transmembrane protein EcfT [Acidimicrobiales bacterium]